MMTARDQPHEETIDRQRIALGIQQPWAELILRGIKTLEIRSQGTQIRGRIYIYASKRSSNLPAAAVAAEKHGLNVAELPRGLLLGSVELVGSRIASPTDAKSACLPAELLSNHHAWELANPQRLTEPQPVRFLPYGVWFYPYRRRSQEI